MASTLAIVAPDMDQGGSVGAVAWRHAVTLGVRHRVFAITQAAPRARAGVEPVIVLPRKWNWMRRYGHVPNELSFLVSARRALNALCLQSNVDVVWCHSHAATVLVARPLARKYGFKVVMTTHGDIFDRPAGTYSRELTWFYKLMTPQAYRCADVVHALSPFMAERARIGGANPMRVHVIPNGIDPADIGLEPGPPRHPASFMPAGRLRLLYVGSLWNVKGVDVLLRAISCLRTPDAEAPFEADVTLVGEGPARGELTRLAQSLAIEDRVNFLGSVARSKLAALYAQSDVLCIPSLSEALPTVAIEAMACGLPIVGSAIGGIPSLVVEGVNGHLAEAGNAKQLAASILKAASSREHLAHLGAQGLARVQESFAWPVIAAQLLKMVDELGCVRKEAAWQAS